MGGKKTRDCLYLRRIFQQQVNAAEFAVAGIDSLDPGKIPKDQGFNVGITGIVQDADNLEGEAFSGLAGQGEGDESPVIDELSGWTIDNDRLFYGQEIQQLLFGKMGKKIRSEVDFGQRVNAHQSRGFFAQGN